MEALNNNDLKRYVRAIFDLESSVYSQNQRIDAFASFVQRKVQSYAPSEVPEELGGVLHCSFYRPALFRYLSLWGRCDCSNWHRCCWNLAISC